MEIKEIGNLKEGQQSWKSPQTGRVYDVTGISPTLNTCGGGGHEVKIVETKVLGGIYTDVTENFNRGLYPNVSRTVKAVKNDAGCIERQIVASRGRNPDNPSDRTAGIPTEQVLEPNAYGVCNALTTVQKDNMVLEKAILTPKRTEYGKQIRKAYEAGEIKESRHNMTELEPRSDGLSNTITTVQKDNMLMETVKIKQATKDGCVECRIGGVADLSYPESETRRGRVIDGGNVSPTLMASQNEIYRIVTQYRVRKLTPKECWRLMGFSDEDYEKAAYKHKTIYLSKLLGEGDDETRSVKLTDVIEKLSQENMGISVSCITNVLQELAEISTEWTKYRKLQEKENSKNVNIVIEKLGKMEHLECAISITKCLESTEMLCGLMEELDQNHTAIIELEEKGSMNTEKYMKISSGESFCLMKLYIILMVLKLIIGSKIYTYSVQKVSICGVIVNLENCKRNMVKMLDLDLKVDIIYTLTSRSQLYKQAGNSIVKQVLMAIFSQLNIKGVPMYNDRIRG